MQHRIAAIGRIFNRIQRIINLWSLEHTSQNSRLVQTKLTSRNSEIFLRSILHTPDPISKIGIIEVHGQDFLLAVFLIDFQSQEKFLGFPLDGLVLRQIGILGQLLGNGRTPTRSTGCQNSQDKTTVVNPAILIESPVLCRDDSILQVLANLGQLDISPFLTRQTSCFIAILVKDERGSFKGILQILDIGRLSHIKEIAADHQAKGQAENQEYLGQMKPAPKTADRVLRERFLLGLARTAETRLSLLFCQLYLLCCFFLRFLYGKIIY